MQLQVAESLESINKAVASLRYYAQEYPQAETEIVALSANGSHVKLVVRFTLGEASEALSGVSEKVEACYGMLNRISLSMYQNRPILSPPPTLAEKSTWASFKERLKT